MELITRLRWWLIRWLARGDAIALNLEINRDGVALRPLGNRALFSRCAIWASPDGADLRFGPAVSGGG